MNTISKLLASTALTFICFLNSIEAQTLTIAQVFGYDAGDIICTRIGQESGLPEYAIDTILSRTVNGSELEIIKKRTLYKYVSNPGKWVGTSSRDTLKYIDINKPYFNRFLSKDSLSITKDTNNNIIAIFEIKDSTFKDPCNRQANYSRYYNYKKSTGSVYQTITVYEKLGTFFRYEQLQSSTIVLIETPQFYIVNGQYCGDSNVMRALRNVSIKSQKTHHFQVGPNPCSNFLNIGINEPFSFEFIDCLGKSIYSGQSEQNFITTEELPAGLYIMNISFAGEIYRYRILKE